MDIESLAYKRSLLAVSAILVTIQDHINSASQEGKQESGKLTASLEHTINIIFRSYLKSTVGSTLEELNPYISFVKAHFISKPAFSNIIDQKLAQVV